MNLALRKTMTLAEFLDWEDRQELKHEFDGFHPVAMVGVTAAHAIIQRNLTTALTNRLRGRPCQFFGPELKIEVVGRIRNPDGFVVCSPVPNDAKVIRDPVIIFEILSPTTAPTDRIVKNAEYKATPSVQRYVMLEQDCIGATVFSRAGDDWVGRILEEPILEMPEIGIEVPLAELYEGLVFEAAGEDQGDDGDGPSSKTPDGSSPGPASGQEDLDVDRDAGNK
jgi:Uma2 family endonuclease